MIEKDGLPSLNHIYAVHGLIVGLCVLILLFIARNTVPAFISGALLITFNFILLVGLWRGVLDKKSIARTTLLVVIKYAILVTVLYVFIKEFKFPLIPMVAGLSTLLGTFVVVAIETHILNRSN